MVQPRGWCKAVTVSLTAVWRAHYDLACAVFLTSPPLAPVLVIIASLINAFLLPLCYSFSAIGLLRVEFFFFLLLLLLLVFKPLFGWNGNELVERPHCSL